jgi:hypothetical protein
VSKSQARFRKSLWDQAYDDLHSEQRELLKRYEEILKAECEIESICLSEEGATEREKQMLALIDKKLEIMNQKKWRLKVNGRSMEIKDKIDQIIKAVLAGVKEGLTPVAISDPIHLGLPLVGMCLLLSVSSPSNP